MNASGAFAYGAHHGITFPGQGISIGGRVDDDPTSPTAHFSGSLDEVRVYGRAMTTQSIQDLYTQPGKYKGSISYEANKETPNFEDVDKQIWKRIINNLPEILKSKGTKRSINQFLACYGIPKTLMNVQEFGGSAPVDGQDFQELTMHNYGLHISESAYVQVDRSSIDVSDYPVAGGADGMTQTIQLRFKSYSQSNNVLHPQQLIKNAGWGIALQPTGTGSYGSAKFYLIHSASAGTIISASVDGLPIFDGDWWNIQLSTDQRVKYATEQDIIYTLRLAKSGDHEDNQITHSGSSALSVTASSHAGSFVHYYNQRFGASAQTTYIGHGSTPIAGASGYSEHFTTGSHDAGDDNREFNFTGSVQEYREYVEAISEDVFHRHTMAPTAYFGNNYTSSYDTLLKRFPFGSDGNIYNHGGIGGVATVSSSHPNQSVARTVVFNSYSHNADFSNFKDETDIDGNYKESVEEHYISVPNSIGNKRTDRKIRNLDTYNDGYLSPNKTHDSSSLDFVGKDSNIVQVALSPTDNVDLDIAYQFGENRVDDWVGDPRDRYKTQYPLMKGLRKEYFKKYSTQPNIFEFSKILNYFNRGFFRQLENLLPARAVKRVGLIIKPNSLERSKIQGIPKILYDATMPSSQSFDSSGIRQRDEYREDWTFEAIVSDTTSSFISGIQKDKTFAIPRDSDYSTADTYESNMILSSRGGYGGAIYYSQSLWKAGTTCSIADFSVMDSRALRDWDGVRDFASTESQLRHRLGRYEKLSAGVASSYYLGSQLKSNGFNEDAIWGNPRFNSIDSGPIVSFILIKTNQLIVKERSSDGSLKVQ
jgi:hypothetical protein